MLRALGWSTDDWSQVRHEYRAATGANPVDYALLDPATGKPMALIEAKALRESVDDPKWAAQLMTYAYEVGARWVALTNGRCYRIYNAHGPGTVEDKLFRSLDVLESEQVSSSELRSMAKASLLDGSVEADWSRFALDRELTTAMEALLAPTPEPKLVSLVKQRVPAASRQDVQNWLRSARVVREGADHERNLATGGPHGPKTKDGSAKGSRGARSAGMKAARTRGANLSLAQLIEAGAVPAPAEVEASYKGRRILASLNPDASVDFDGHVYPSLSAAGGAAKRSVQGGPRIPATNGWDFWKIRDSRGRLRYLKNVRADYLRQRRSLRGASV